MRIFGSIALTGLLFLSAGCTQDAFMSGHPQAVCQVSSLGSGPISGTVFFTQETGEILVEADIKGLKPGSHGIHIHEHGDCGGVEGKAAGGHFNPTKGMHGMAGMVGGHEGDLGNIVADANGEGRLTLRDKVLELSGANSILGRSIIVHADADDLVSQPAGNSGARIACGVIVAGAPAP
jgi:Cu-Zn family superoxide dismutase